MTTQNALNPPDLSQAHTYQVNEGFFGKFGGSFVPELLRANVEELAQNYLKILKDPSFQKRYQRLLSTYNGRQTPLYLAENLSKKFNRTIYLKREDLAHTGSHKVNNALGQSLLAQSLGKTHIIAETGAGQHGVATASVCALLGLKCTIFMGAEDIKRQMPNALRIKMLGAELVSVTSGTQTLQDAVTETLRYWINHADSSHYVIGSCVGPHPYPDLVCQLQRVIGQETAKQLLLEGINDEVPLHLVACVGGGSNAIGFFYDFLTEKRTQMWAAEAAGLGAESPQTAASITSGRPGVMHGSFSYLLQDKDGQIQPAHSISAGLDYPGIGPIHAHLHDIGRVKFVPVTDDQALEWAQHLSRLEGIIPALESAHALAILPQVVQSSQKEDVVVLNLSGRGDKDMPTYQQFFKQDNT